MANRVVVGKIMVVLELPDENILRTPPSEYPVIDIPKTGFGIVNELILQGVSVTDWVSNGVRWPGGHRVPVVTLTFEGV